MSERLIHLLRTRPASSAADAELLSRWADRRDEAAFELLLRRHAEPVWRTCRAVAGQGAEDAFQATFLALARRAGAVRGNLPGWLHAVARHASLRARRFVGRVESSRPDSGDSLTVGPRRLDPTYEDLAPLHEELARLPAAYRLPILLCHLHGRTQAEAAAELGLPLGTVATRVRRGCDRLRTALLRRGFDPALGFGPPLVVPTAVTAAALGLGLGAVAAPPAIHTLAKGAASAMSRTKLKLLTAVTLLTAAAGGGALVARHPAADPPKPVAADGKPADWFDRMAGAERMKSVMLAWWAHEEKVGHLPRDIAGPDGKPLLSWRVAVLPLLDQEYLYSQFRRDEPWDSEHNKKLLPHLPKVFRSPGAGPGLTRVKAFRGPHAALDPAKPLKVEDFTDGTSNTLALAEAGPPVPWTQPSDHDFVADKPLPDLAGPFADGFATAFADGSARWLRRTLPEKTLREFVTRDGGEVTPWNTDGPAPAKRPLTAREKQRADELHRYLTDRQTEDWQYTIERMELVAALGEVGPPAVPPADDLDALESAQRARDSRRNADHNESARLLELLKAKNPQRAKELEEKFQKRWDELIRARKERK